MLKNLFLLNRSNNQNLAGNGYYKNSAGISLFQLPVFCLILTSLLIPQHSFAESGRVKPDLSLCPAPGSDDIIYKKPRSFAGGDIENTEVSADSTTLSNDGSISLDGNVVIDKNQLNISSDSAFFDKSNEQLDVSGNVSINTEDLSLLAESGTVDMASAAGNNNRNQARFTDIRFIIPESNMKGRAGTILTNQFKKNGSKQSTLTDADITSCELTDPDWLISADEIWLDHDDEYGSADDVVIRFKGVPFLYTPYIEFPTSDRRRSGLLFPAFGSSSTRGIELSVPWYWNIAPNQDAIIEPRFMDKRGLELGGNYRYLTQSTQGKLNGNYLHNDEVTDEQRYYVKYRQLTRLMPDLHLDIDFQDISDTDYFNDFANDLDSTSQTHLNRSATLSYNLVDWRFMARVQDIKTIDESIAINNRPYERLPQLTFIGDTEIADGPLFFTLDSEVVNFTHDSDTITTGTRITVRPGLRLPLSGAAWFLEPAIKFSHTQYDVGTQGDTTQPGTSTQVDNRNLPMTSIDAGLFFERDLDNGFHQTLEPRLYYLNVPFEDQSNTPLFDTSIPDFSVAQLFRDNRFVGGDRIGDANQLTAALTSRILKTDTGDELLRASIGQIFYFDDREVSLDGTVDTAHQSDVIAEFDTYWGRWQGNIDLQWDTSNDELSRENYFLHYKSDARHLFNLGYRKRLEDGALDIEQTDVSFVFPLSREYVSFARWNYSLKDDKNIDVIAGLAFDSCCWSIQLIGQRRLKNTTEAITNDEDDYDNSILVQFVFKGIGSLSGSRTRQTLEQSIYGYTDVFR